jgi:hypothetical protein
MAWLLVDIGGRGNQKPYPDLSFSSAYIGSSEFGFSDSFGHGSLYLARYCCIWQDIIQLADLTRILFGEKWNNLAIKG